MSILGRGCGEAMSAIPQVAEGAPSRVQPWMNGRKSAIVYLASSILLTAKAHKCEL